MAEELAAEVPGLVLCARGAEALDGTAASIRAATNWKVITLSAD